MNLTIPRHLTNERQNSIAGLLYFKIVRSTMRLPTVAGICMVFQLVLAADPPMEFHCSFVDNLVSYMRLAFFPWHRSSLTACGYLSGYNVRKATSIPTADETKKMCSTPACHQGIGALKNTQLPNCSLLLPSFKRFNLFMLASEFEDTCYKLKVIDEVKVMMANLTALNGTRI
uniref:Elicitin n=1 Tax=Albugo laibachii Nc14 TaxID=890382 RepID=F0W6W4_9STRA|nr:AlNc14C26G2600 [Albugo laibachii Nc14]|eukprot:CCA16859.1 AlNc14C26G2600 [Albugo laibachii Nc14]